ncbi:MAG TPA: hypothetical protein VFL76_05365 [Edaphocola sp.]|nr:hypothetical protein [Edaphocola sp.]
MLRQVIQKKLKSSGKNYFVDKDIPDSLIALTLYKRIIMMIRGILKIRKVIFLGRHVRIYNKSNFSVGANCTIENSVVIDCYAKEKITFGDSVKIGANSIISVTSHLSKYGIGLKIGNHSSIGEYSYIGSSGGIEIGNDVIMGQFISFHSENHYFSDKNKLIREQGVYSQGIKLGNNIWVGAKVTFLDGCAVSDNSIVASGAVVKGSFPPNVIIGGVPAKIIKEI